MARREGTEMGMADKKKNMSEWMKWEGGPAQNNDERYYELMSFQSAPHSSVKCWCLVMMVEQGVLNMSLKFCNYQIKKKKSFTQLGWGGKKKPS